MKDSDKRVRLDMARAGLVYAVECHAKKETFLRADLLRVTMDNPNVAEISAVKSKGWQKTYTQRLIDQGVISRVPGPEEVYGVPDPHLIIAIVDDADNFGTKLAWLVFPRDVPVSPFAEKELPGIPVVNVAGLDVDGFLKGQKPVPVPVIPAPASQSEEAAIDRIADIFASVRKTMNTSLEKALGLKKEILDQVKSLKKRQDTVDSRLLELTKRIEAMDARTGKLDAHLESAAKENKISAEEITTGLTALSVSIVASRKETEEQKRAILHILSAVGVIRKELNAKDENSLAQAALKITALKKDMGAIEELLIEHATKGAI